MLEWLKNLFSENSTASTMRFATIISIGLFIPAFVISWTWISLHNFQLENIPDGVAWFLGVLLGAKAIQKAVEVAGQVLGNKDKSQPPTP